MRAYLFPFFTALILSTIALIRVDGFSIDRIHAPLFKKGDLCCSFETKKILSQPFFFLAKGRQCFVFESQDQKYVLKFFNRKYIETPWYAPMFKKEGGKRKERKRFYYESYPLAQKTLNEKILYLHLAPSFDLPTVCLHHRALLPIELDLNSVPFVLQKKGADLHSALLLEYEKVGIFGVYRMIDAFFSALDQRLDKRIKDGDSDIIHNWGVIDEELVQIDPGRLFFDASLELEKEREKQRSLAYRKLRKWLKKNIPEAVEYLKIRQCLEK